MPNTSPPRYRNRLAAAAGWPILWLILLCTQTAQALEFRSVGDAGAVFFDAPSAQAKKLFVAKRYYPVAVVVNLEQWCKVKDAGGDLSWVEKRALSEQRTVIVTAPRAQMRAAPDAASALVFEAEKDVALEVLAIVNPDWARVRHVGGQSGFVRADEVWGL